MQIADLAPTIVYAISFAILLAWLILSKNNVSKYIVAIWLCSAISAIFFQCLMPIYRKISIIPYVYMLACFFISLKPVVSCDGFIRRYNFEQNNKLLMSVMWFFVIISIIPFGENLKQVLVSTNASNGTAIADMYNSKMYGGGFKVFWLSSVGMLFNSIDGIFVQFLFFVPFYLLTQPKVKKMLLILMFVPLANHLLFQIAASGRGTVVLFIMNSIFFFLFFKNHIPSSRMRIAKIVGISFLGLLIMALSIITFARKDATNAGDDDAVFVGYYIAKSHLDFNEKMWGISVYTQGDNTFAFFKNAIGLDTFKSFLKKEAFWGSKIGIPPGNFYTYIGDCYMDFGPIITLFIFIIISVVAYAYFASNKKVTMMRLFWFFAYCQVIIMGWSINYFKPYDATRNLLVSSLLLYVIQVISSKRGIACLEKKRG